MKRVFICLAFALLGATVVQAQSLDENDILKSLTQGKTLPTPPTEEELYGPDEEEVVKAESATNVEVPKAVVSKAVEPKAEENVMPKLDSMLCVWSEKNRFMACEEILNPQILADTIDLPASEIPDSVYIERLKAIGSAIPLSYNEVVRKYIISYTTRNKQVISNALGRAQYYFPIFEAELDAQQMPLELRMLPVIESALIPKARSKKGAAGLWQFMYGTSKGYKLEVSSFIDERFDPVKSTNAGCRFLKYLYNTYGDWLVALAAYNCGPGNVNKALRKADGGKTFWELYPYLPPETRGYVPAFIATTYAFHYHKQHGIKPIEAPLPIATDTLTISRILHFDQVSSTIGTPKDVLRALNPQFKQDIVPAVRGREYSLVLPVGEVGKFLDHEAEIMGKDTIYLREYMNPRKNGEIPTFTIDSKIHKVKQGENLSIIARKYGVTVKQICKWNNIKDPSKIRVGQKLEIFLK
ncbi:MAG: transglycosylase SLT domain-containing protein [Tidjanibacter sp.]|nr:transglycosylase SLT domain-containing protein [Tidjanibacter sp.]